MFNKKASSKKSKPDEVLKALALKPGVKIADIGSGGGYFAFRFAEAAGPSGEVFCVDNKQEYLDHILSNASQKGLNNVKTALIAEKVPALPDKYFDLIFLRNVYHHLEERVELMKFYRDKLKPAGRLAIIEYRPGGSLFSFRRMFGHNVPQDKIVSEMEQAGCKKAGEYGFLPEQSFTIFTVL